jgi:hypothetical protein
VNDDDRRPAPIDRVGGVSEWRALDPDRVVHLVEQMVRAGHLLSSVPAPDVAKYLGWPVTHEVPGTLATLDAGLGLGGREVSLMLDDDGLASELFADVTTQITDSTPEAHDFKLDVFARTAAALTGRFGPPARRRAGETPHVEWRIGDLTLQLEVAWVTVELRLLPTAVVEAQEASDG